MVVLVSIKITALFVHVLQELMVQLVQMIIILVDLHLVRTEELVPTELIHGLVIVQLDIMELHVPMIIQDVHLVLVRMVVLVFLSMEHLCAYVQ
jgi:hypothetical protein